MLEQAKKESPIIEATLQGDIIRIQKILAEDPNAYLNRNEYGVLPISIAASRGQAVIVTCFLQHAVNNGYQYPVFDALVRFAGKVPRAESFALLIDFIQKNRSVFTDQLPESHFQAIVNNQQYFEDNPTSWYESNDLGITTAYFSIVLGHRSLNTFTHEIIVSPKRVLTDNELRELSNYHHCLISIADYPYKNQNIEKNLQTAIALCEQIKEQEDVDWSLLSDCQYRLASFYYKRKSNQKNEEEHLLKAITLSEKIKHKGDYNLHMLGISLLALANLYRGQRKQEKEETSLHKAITTIEQMTNQDKNKWRNLGQCQLYLASLYRRQNNPEAAERYYRKAIASYDQVQDKRIKRTHQLVLFTELAVHLNNNSGNLSEAAQLLNKSLKRRNKIFAENGKADQKRNIELFTRETIVDLLDYNMFDEAARYFMDFMDLYYLCPEVNNKLKHNFNQHPEVKDISFAKGYRSAMSRYQSLYAYKETYADLLDLMAGIFKTEKAPDLPDLYLEISTILKNELHLTHPSIRSALNLFAKLLRFAVEHALDDDCKELINPAIQSACKSGKKDEIIKSIETFEKQIEFDFNLRGNIDQSALDQYAALKAENDALNRELIELKKEKALRLEASKCSDSETVANHGIFSPTPKRERDEADEEVIRDDEQTKRIKIESSEENNNHKESGAEPATKK
jgi:hypothetical protein